MLYWRVVAWGGALSTLPHFVLVPRELSPRKTCQEHALAPLGAPPWRRRAVRAPVGDAAAPFR